MTRWLEIARSYEGTAEVPGARANPVILGWLQNEGKGKSWVKDDSTPWCGAHMAGVFTAAGLAHIIPDEPLRARSWANAGVALDGPRVGAIIVRPRTGGAHVGLVERWDATHVWIRGGNQHDSCNVSRFARTSSDVYRWPVPIKSAREIESEGSRIAKAARRQQQDGALGLTSGSSPAMVPAPAPGLPEAAYGPPAPSLADQVQQIPETLASVKAIAGSVVEFAGYVGAKWPLIALALAAYFTARMMWDGWRIRTWRTQMSNEGRS